MDSLSLCNINILDWKIRSMFELGSMEEKRKEGERSLFVWKIKDWNRRERGIKFLSFILLHPSQILNISKHREDMEKIVKTYSSRSKWDQWHVLSHDVSYLSAAE